MKEAILIFAKNPIYGQVKTRLAATVGNDSALAVYKYLLQHTASVTNYLPVNKIVFYSNSVEENDCWPDEVFEKQLQAGTDLGERMTHAFEYAFARGNKEVVIIGTDCLEITSPDIMNAFALLKKKDVVIGPATDGGYYLLGLKAMHAQIFMNINWSTDKVLQQTLAICKAQNLSVFQLPVLSDIDNEDDMSKEQKELFQIKQVEI